VLADTPAVTGEHIGLHEFQCEAQVRARGRRLLAARKARGQSRGMALTAFLAKVVGWLRAGYPDGVPERDYIPLFALLGSQLTDDEVTLIAGELAFSAAPESAREIKKAVSAITRATVSDSDIARVRSHLAAGGWPLETPDRD